MQKLCKMQKFEQKKIYAIQIKHKEVNIINPKVFESWQTYLK